MQQIHKSALGAIVFCFLDIGETVYILARGIGVEVNPLAQWIGIFGLSLIKIWAMIAMVAGIYYSYEHSYSEIDRIKKERYMGYVALFACVPVIWNAIVIFNG